MPSPLCIDTVRLTGPVDRKLLSLPERSTVRTDSSGTGVVHRESVRFVRPNGARCGVIFDGDRATGWVEASLPKVLTGSNMRALPYDDAMSVMRQVLVDATEVLPWEDAALERLSPNRVDVVLDVQDVRSTDRLLRSWAQEHKAQLFFGKNGAQSLCLGARSYRRLMIYDKTAEAGGARRVGGPRHLRIETQLFKSFLRRQGVTTVEQLSSNFLESQRAKAFDYYNLGRGLITPNDIHTAIAGTRHSDSIKGGMLYTYFEQKFGRGPFSNATRRAHQQRLASLERDGNFHSVVRIDYETAQEVHGRE